MRILKFAVAIAAVALSADAEAKVKIVGTIAPGTQYVSFTGPNPYIEDTIPLLGWLRVRFNRPVTGYFSGDGEVYATSYDADGNYVWDENAGEGGSTLFTNERVKGVNFTVTDFMPAEPGGHIEASSTDFNYEFILYGLDRQVRYSITSIRPGAIPEPASWALMIMGFGGIGSMMRRRKRRVLRMS